MTKHEAIGALVTTLEERYLLEITRAFDTSTEAAKYRAEAEDARLEAFDALGTILTDAQGRKPIAMLAFVRDVANGPHSTSCGADYFRVCDCGVIRAQALLASEQYVRWMADIIVSTNHN